MSLYDEVLHQLVGHIVLHVCLGPWPVLAVPPVKAAKLAISLLRWEAANAIFVVQEAMRQPAVMSAVGVHRVPIPALLLLNAHHVKRAGLQKAGETQLVNLVWLVPMLMKGGFADSVPEIRSQPWAAASANHVLVPFCWLMQMLRE